MDFNTTFRALISRCLLGLIFLSFLAPAAYPADSEDAQIFITGFNAYQKKDYQGAVDSMSLVLQKYPDTPLRDMAIFWLARSHYKRGDRAEAAKQMARFFREYPDSPLKGTVEDDLAQLARAYEQGSPLPSPPPSVAMDKRAPEGKQTTAATPEKKDAGPADRSAAEKAAAEKTNAEAAARAKADADRLAAEKAAAERSAKVRAALKEKAEAKRAEREKADQEKLAATQSALPQVKETPAAPGAGQAATMAEPKQGIQEQAMRDAEARKELERQAAEQEARKAAEEKLKFAERAAAEKAEQERLAAQKRQEQAEEAARLAAASTVSQPPDVSGTAAAPKNDAATRGVRVPAGQATAMKEKAIAEYKDLIDRFPGTAAAASAKARLAELGIEYGGRGKGAAPPPIVGNAQVLTFEVAQFAGVGFSVPGAAQPAEVNRRIKIPFEVVNRGNGQDSFYLESGFPAPFGAQFEAAGKANIPVNLTPPLAPGQKFAGTLELAIPPGFIDGAKINYPIKAASQLSGEVSQSRDISLIASAPLLRMVLKADKAQVLPGEKVTYHVTLLNIGTSNARGLGIRLDYPPQYEPVGYVAAGFKQEMKATLVIDGVELGSGQSREFVASFQLKEEALAQQELFLRGEVVNDQLDSRDSFISTATVVQAVTNVIAKAATNRLVVIPGQVVSIPVVITNAGNVRDDFTIRPQVPESLSYTFYQDQNRDGVRQSNEPVINHVGPLAPREESYAVIEVATNATERDGIETSFEVGFESELNRSTKGSAQFSLLYSRPVVELSMIGKGGRLKPGEVSSFDLTFTNRGSNMAKLVELESTLPSPLELVASDPPFGVGNAGEYKWKVEELGPGEKRNISVSFRVKPEAVVGTNIQLKNVLKYQDQLGNRY